ncbi:hypothetical protein BpHYR1_020241 [Brachionus plicatilis]|uniref:Uncharacterized protein n=1 Tax=Brachionus plicatilis TaxID=10195 RepID=A0A3M7R5W6_BRAPC|nr:hypothetical protein BpHYR1_020241 [Brachionus plicatilis]
MSTYPLELLSALPLFILENLETSANYNNPVSSGRLEIDNHSKLVSEKQALGKSKVKPILSVCHNFRSLLAVLITFVCPVLSVSVNLSVVCFSSSCRIADSFSRILNIQQIN